MALRVDSSSTKVILGFAAVAALAVGVVLFLRHRRIAAAEPTATSLAQKNVSIIRSLPGIGRAVNYFFPMKAAKLPVVTIGRSSPISNVKDLTRALEGVKQHYFKELGALIIYGDHLEIVQDPGILALNLQKLILVGAQIVPSTEASSLEQCMVNGEWLVNNENGVFVSRVSSVDEAVKAPLITNAVTTKPIPMVFSVKA